MSPAVNRAKSKVQRLEITLSLKAGNWMQLTSPKMTTKVCECGKPHVQGLVARKKRSASAVTVESEKRNRPLASVVLVEKFSHVPRFVVNWTRQVWPAAPANTKWAELLVRNSGLKLLVK